MAKHHVHLGVTKLKYKHLSWMVFAAFLLQTGCASVPKRTHSAKSTRSVTEGVASPGSGAIEHVITSTEGAVPVQRTLYYKGMKIDNSVFDLPVEMNPAVEKWIAYFTGKGRGHFEKYLTRSEIFIPFLQPILRAERAPEDLVYLAMIESGFNNRAASHARAVGAWQFISATGRRYGLEVDWWIDERRDVAKSTHAAVNYLKDLYVMYGSWHLAAASYNAGEAKIARAIKMYKTNDFWELCTAGKYLRPETKNYVPKLFAAAIIAKNRKQFGFAESGLKTSAGLVVAAAEADAPLAKLPDQLDEDRIEDTKNSDEAEASTTNPEEDAAEDAMLAADDVEQLLRLSGGDVDAIRTPHVNKKGDVFGDVLTEVEIPSPADLFRVAKATGISYAHFKSMNPHFLRWVTPVTEKTVKVKIPAPLKDRFTKRYFDPDFDRDVVFLEYKARKGESVKSIAKRFRLSPDPVAQMNGVSAKGMAPAGRMMKLPIPADYVRSLASLKELELIDPPTPKKASRSKKYRGGKAKKKRI